MRNDHVIIPEKCCLNCHLLAARNEKGDWESAPFSEREELKTGDENCIRTHVTMLHSYSCHKGVFLPAKSLHDVIEDMRTRPQIVQSADYERLTEERRETCFFYPFQPRMSLAAGDELERRASDRREADKDREVTRLEGVEDRKLTRGALRIARRNYRIAVAAAVAAVGATIVAIIAVCSGS